MEESTEELEPLFDYSRVQPKDVIWIDDADDCLDSPPTPSRKRKSSSTSLVEEAGKSGKVVNVTDSEENEEDWLPPPPKISNAALKIEPDSTIKELRLKKQELASFAQSAEDELRAVEESAKREVSSSMQSLLNSQESQPSKPLDERAKVVISIQDKEGVKQFRVFMDEKFERIFKMYAEKVKRDIGSLVFCFDGDKISPTATPDGLGMEDNDIIEVHDKSR
ncbi:PREDICTED: uncharacterized protein LOC104613312 [Nelumbo nucifera]|uniref:Uncharacterized protein LOC104613312 n=2 Tax=Nelumbo nucifera TaxID=4432 RepID=A0A1U8BDA0_NELNU|nr:PREDICTED: uncharacterized protein LOC104613312 [Nelumbo nucifera]DAD31895.1 TPA_asm: hypothetical protein HUJ06_010746 [Nelumbo nucifera]